MKHTLLLLTALILSAACGIGDAAAQACLQHAIAVARSLQAKSLELRAATSLAHQCQCQDKCVAARELLVPIYGWFTVGFDTADLQEAKVLLEELS